MGDRLADNASESDRKDLLSELRLMKELDAHPHVIELLGCVTKSGKCGKVYFNSPNNYFHHFPADLLLSIKIFHVFHALRGH